MNLVTLLPLILIVGVMLMMTRSAKNKQRQAADMRNQMEPGAGVRTIGGMYAVVKEVNDETVLLELTDGVQAHFAKNAIGTVLSEGEFNRIVHGIEPDEIDGDPDEASAVDVAADDASVQDDARPDLLKKDAGNSGETAGAAGAAPVEPEKAAAEAREQDRSGVESK